MKILAINTATPCCSVTVVDETKITACFAVTSRQTHARQLLPLIDQALKSCRLTVGDLDGLAAVRGPGSFTGLRIGISTVKGLALAGNKPLAGISSLDALASPFTEYPGPVCALIDARKNEVYACWYRPGKNAMEKLTTETVLSPESAAMGQDGPCLFVGTGARAYRERIENTAKANARFAPAFQNDIRPEVIAHLAVECFQNNITDTPENFAPVYIRPPDAVAAGRKPSPKYR